MLHMVKREYLEDATIHMLHFALDPSNENYGHWREILESVNEVCNSNADGTYTTGAILFMDTEITMEVRLAPGVRPNQVKKRSDLIIEEVSAHGNLVEFLAFCFQEGELLPDGRHNSGYKYRGEYEDSTLFLRVDRPSDIQYCIIDIHEWREYIKNKYRILPPKLGDGFLAILRYNIIVTGGVALAGTANEVSLRGDIK